MADPKVSYVSDAESLRRLVSVLSAPADDPGSPEPPISLDTEADSFHHYFEKVCLLQLGHGEEAVLVDPLNGLDLGPLLEVLGRRRLLLHGADYDVRLLYRGYGFRPRAIFDTMIAAQLLGETELGLAAQLAKRVGVTLDKANQRADWSERPLAPDMVAYAAKDVLHLPALAASLEADLVAKGRLAWLEEECERLVAMEIAPREEDPETDWRIKGTNALTSQERAFVRALWIARELRAKETDKPPFRVLTNERLLVAAKKAAQGEARLPELFPGPRPLPPPFARAVAHALAEARALPPESWPTARRPQPFESNPALERMVEELKRKRDRVAKELALDPGVVASRATMTAAARARIAFGKQLGAEELVTATGMSRWRAGILGAA